MAYLTSVFEEYITSAHSVELMIGILIVFSGFLLVSIRKNRAIENSLKSTNKEMSELRVSEERYRLVAESSNAGLWKERMAYYDSLTNLPNRKLLAEKFNQQLIEAGTEDAIGAILIIDIDNFKRINDTIGYNFGDRLLIEIGNKFIAMDDQQHMVAKLGGDEFIVLLTEVGSRSLVSKHAEKIMQIFESPFVINNNSFHISASIGIALCPDDGTDVDELLKNADTAMNKVKESGKRSYRFFDSTMNDAVVEKINLDRYLRAAIANHEFLLYYQPQINILTGKMTGFEALIRWLSPEYGMISPIKFISLAEESGLILPIGEWVLRTACLFNKNLQDKGCGTFYVSVNISVVQLIQENFISMVIDILQETGLSPTLLELEITETVLMDSFESNVQKLETLKAMGIKISLDDFGKGYSSLNYLKQLPITTLKIDKSFIDDITSDNVNAAITSSIIMLAHEMGLKVIAEGVETQEQFNHLNDKNCDMIQGYLISKPVPGEEIDRLFNQ
ncbi:MAG TPA: EAL domain-containing protein [Negativicutes bacterium]